MVVRYCRSGGQEGRRAGGQEVITTLPYCPPDLLPETSEAASRRPRSFSLCFLLLPLRRDLEQRWSTIHHRILRDLDLLHVLTRRQIEHHVGEDLLHDRAQTARARTALERLLRDGAQCAVLEGELHF